MELRDGLRALRTEVGLTQTELAGALNVSYAAVNRWENGKSRPTRAAALAILALARRRQVSPACMECLSHALLATRAEDGGELAPGETAEERAKIEKRELLTSDQLKTTLDHINIGVFGMRAYSTQPSDVEIFYFNRHLARMLGYPEASFLHVYRNDPYVSIHPEDLPRYLDKLDALVTGRQPLDAFDVDIRLFREDNATLWVNVKAISAKAYSFGREIFASCTDISARVEAERKYREELLYRTAVAKDSLAYAHCDLTHNAVTRFTTSVSALKSDAFGGTADGLISHISQHLPEGEEREEFLRAFNRDAMLAAYAEDRREGGVTSFDRQLRRWIRTEYYLMGNPTRGTVEALIHTRDIHQKWLSKHVIDVIAQRFFDYIGCIDTVTGVCEPCYQSERIERLPQKVISQYHKGYAELVRQTVVPEDVEQTIAHMDLAYVRQRLETTRFYTCLTRMREGSDVRQKQILFTYLDSAKRLLIIARSDLGDLSALADEQKADLAAYMARRE